MLHLCLLHCDRIQVIHIDVDSTVYASQEHSEVGFWQMCVSHLVSVVFHQRYSSWILHENLIGFLQPLVWELGV